MTALLKTFLSGKIRMLVSHWNGYFQLEVNCIENNVDLCF